jgi:type I restriction enzyme S subunit
MKEGWQTKKLADVATLQRGFDLPTQDRTYGEIPLVTSSGISDTVNKSAVCGPGVATGRSGSIGNVFFIDEDFWPLNTVLYVKDFHGNDPRFVFYLLQKFDLKRFATGTGVPTLNRNFVHDELVHIPPLPEQKRIVALLDEAFAGLSTAKANDEQNLQNARAIFESHLESIFSQRGEHWEERRIEDWCESVMDCVNKTAPVVETPTPFKMLRTTNIRNGKVDGSTVKYVTQETYTTWTRRQVPQRGDVILTREAPMGEVGMILSDEKVFLGQRLVSYRANPKELDHFFLLYALQSRALQDQIHAKASGSTVQHMRVPDSKNLLLAAPSLQKQRAIVGQLKALQADTQHLTHLYERKLADLEELKKALLHQAFHGEL